MRKSIERKYICSCKKEIEKVLALDNGNSSLKSSDLEYLSRLIREKSGINISLSTLKRLWKEDFAQLPQPATLNALASVLDYKNWQEFKQASQIKVKRTSLKIILAFIGIILTVTVLLVGLLYMKLQNNKSPKKPKINGPIYFSAKKTVTSGIPNTVIFNYDVTNVKADSFFIQQTWNDYHKVRIDPKGHVFSSIYYESGYHRARLIANNTEIAMQPIHILSNGWEPHIYYNEKDLIPIDFKNETFIEGGQFHLKKSLLEKHHVDFSKYFFSRICYSQKFNISSDNFDFVTRLKVDSMQNSLCPWLNLIIVTEKHIFRVLLVKKGCERHASYKLGEIVRNGGDQDLSALGCNIFEWQEIRINVHNKNAEICINGKAAFNEVFKEDFGKIVGFIYLFEGTGSIDYVKLTGLDGQMMFEDNFEKQ
ncbi:MAG TPA: hypothetical protein VIH57_19625 [Bacteroidales bacterium]